jgi:HK97 family phage prohead protease
MTKSIIRKTHVSTKTAGLEFILSDASIDRYGDSISVEGWQLDRFNRNPICLFNHESSFPIGRWRNIGVKDNSLRGHLELAPQGSSPRIDEVRALVGAGILRAVSVGFLGLEHSPLKSGTRYTKSELVECSLVSVPANSNALAVARSLGTSRATMAKIFTNGHTVSEHIERARQAVAQEAAQRAAQAQAKARATLKRLEDREIEELIRREQNSWAGQKAIAEAESNRRSAEIRLQMEREHIAMLKREGRYVDPNPAPSEGKFVVWRGQKIYVGPTWRGKKV